MADLTVANTILEQLGGNKFRVMTGAKMFSGSEKGLTFRLPGGGGFCKDGINSVQIELTPGDEYIMTFARIRGVNVKVVSMFRDIQCDQLQEIFTEATGLRTSLGVSR